MKDIFPQTVQAEVISPNEARFWQEQANRAPALVRSEVDTILHNANGGMTAYKIGGIGLGAALGVATFTKHVSGRWKWLSGAGAAASLAFGLIMGGVQNITLAAQSAIAAYAEELGRNPALRQQLATHLSTSVTAEDIQALGLERAVAGGALEFGMRTQHLKMQGNYQFTSQPLR